MPYLHLSRSQFEQTMKTGRDSHPFIDKKTDQAVQLMNPRQWSFTTGKAIQGCILEFRKLKLGSQSTGNGYRYIVFDT